MPPAIEHRQTVFKHGSATFLARVLGNDGEPITQETVDAIEYTIYLIDPADEDADVAVTDHTAVDLAAADSVFNLLQLDERWTADEVGYNFRHVLDVTHQAFTIAGREYRVVFTITPTAAGEPPILLRYRVPAV